MHSADCDHAAWLSDKDYACIRAFALLNSEAVNSSRSGDLTSSWRVHANEACNDGDT